MSVPSLPRSRRWRRALAAGVVAAGLVTVAAACGGDDEADGSSLDDRATALEACITDAGLTAAARETTPLGVEVPLRGVTVSGLPGDNEAQVWLFETPEAAEDARPAITLVTVDNERSKLAGRSVLRFNNLPLSAHWTIISGCVEDPAVA